MKRAQIEALVSAHRGQTLAVASLHVLGQPSLEEDDHVFLGEQVRGLDLCDLLRWLARCDEGSARGAIVRALSREAARSPQRFAYEALGAAGRFLNEHEWGEVAALCRGQVPGALYAALLAKTGGSPTFRAVAGATRWAPTSPLTACFFPEASDDEGLEARVRRAFEPRGASALVADALSEIRYDEGACRRALGAPPEGADRARWLYELERAGLLPGSLAGLLPASTAWCCETTDEGEALRQAFVRHLASCRGGDEGEAWLLGQLEAALGRGAPAAALLAEAPAGLRGAIAQKAPGLLALARGQAGAMPLRSLLLLRSLLPEAVDDEALAQRAWREATEGDDDWGPRAALLPAGLKEAALARVRRSRRGPEVAALLDWLRGQGLPRRALVDLAVESVAGGLLHRALIAWLAGQLTTRSSWEQRGTEVLLALIQAEALPELSDLLAMAWSEAAQGQPDREPPEGLCGAIHGAFAAALLRQTEEALASGDRPRALSLASAMVCLDPPPRFRRQLYGQGRTVDGEVEQMLDVVRSLTRHGDGGDATLKGAIAAVHALASR